MDVRQVYLLTVSVWALVPYFGALRSAGAPGLPPIYAYFEGVSGITTTGASVIVGVEDLPLGMNLWRGIELVGRAWYRLHRHDLSCRSCASAAAVFSAPKALTSGAALPRPPTSPASCWCSTAGRR
jgi:hypothetical protein